MNQPSIDELRNLLIKRCPDYAGIEVTHLGRYRVRINAVTPDGFPTQFVMSLSDEDAPLGWATDVSKALNRMVAV